MHTYINRLDDTLTDEAYVNLRESIEQMDKNNQERISSLKRELYKLGNGVKYMSAFMQSFCKYQGISELTREVVASLIERILIGADKSIEFKFADEMQKYAPLYGDMVING